MRCVEIADSVREGGDASLFLIRHLRDGGRSVPHMPEHVGQQRNLHTLFARHLRELAHGKFEVHQQLLGSVFRLSPALGIEAGFDRWRVDMRHTIGVSIHHGLPGIFACAGQGFGSLRRGRRRVRRRRITTGQSCSQKTVQDSVASRGLNIPTIHSSPPPCLSVLPKSTVRDAPATAACELDASALLPVLRMRSETEAAASIGAWRAVRGGESIPTNREPDA